MHPLINSDISSVFTTDITTALHIMDAAYSKGCDWCRYTAVCTVSLEGWIVAFGTLSRGMVGERVAQQNKNAPVTGSVSVYCCCVVSVCPTEGSIVSPQEHLVPTANTEASPRQGNSSRKPSFPALSQLYTSRAAASWPQQDRQVVDARDEIESHV